MTRYQRTDKELSDLDNMLRSSKDFEEAHAAIKYHELFIDEIPIKDMAGMSIQHIYPELTRIKNGHIRKYAGNNTTSYMIITYRPPKIRVTEDIKIKRTPEESLIKKTLMTILG